jgi:hypothetical protein
LLSVLPILERLVVFFLGYLALKPRSRMGLLSANIATSDNPEILCSFTAVYLKDTGWRLLQMPPAQQHSLPRLFPRRFLFLLLHLFGFLLHLRLVRF